ncbi:hypothetical protein AGMMS50262_22860 [Bacteroidia bacterium]|nr:hypothetical protein AGMMS50262_22860 [Bacteroidia bacterium]
MTTSTACNNITWTDANKNGTLADSSGVSLSIKGNADFSGAKRVNPVLYFIGKAPGSYTVNSGNDSIYTNRVFFSNQGTSYELVSDFIMANRMFFYHTAGELIANNKKLVVGRFASNLAFPAGAVRTLDLKGSEIRCAQPGQIPIAYAQALTLNKTAMTAYDFSDSHFILEPSILGQNIISTQTLQTTDTFTFNRITFTNALTNNLQFDRVNNIIDTLTFLNNGTMGNRGFTVNTLILAPNKTYLLPSYAGTLAAQTDGRTVTVNDTIISNTSSCIGLTLSGVNASNNTGIILNASSDSLSIPGATITNVNYRHATQLGVPGGMDGGGNTNINFEAASPRAFYWIPGSTNGSGSWSDPSHWSLTSGINDNPLNCIPNRLDTVYFDAGSFSTTNQTVDVDITPLNIVSMFWKPEAGAQTPVFKLNGNTLNLSGSLTLASGLIWSANSGIVNFTGEKTDPYSQFIEANGVTFTSTTVNISGTGRFDLKEAISAGSVFTFTGGDFYTHGSNITSGESLYITQSATDYIDLSTSVIRSGTGTYITIVNCDNFISDNASLTSGYPNHTLTNSCPVRFKSITNTYVLGINLINSASIYFEKMSLTGVQSNHRINGLVETDTLSFYGNLTITAGRTVTVNNELNILSGTPCAKVSIAGSSAVKDTLVLNPHCVSTAANRLIFRRHTFRRSLRVPHKFSSFARHCIYL